MNLIGLWQIKVNNIKVELMRSRASILYQVLWNLFRLTTKQRLMYLQSFNSAGWHVIHDQRCAYTIMEVNSLDENCNAYWNNVEIYDRPTTSKNPQSNFICEQMHQTMGDIFRTILHGEAVFNNAGSYCGQALATSMHALCATASRSLDNHSPGKIAFNRHIVELTPSKVNISLVIISNQVTTLKQLNQCNQHKL